MPENQLQLAIMMANTITLVIGSVVTFLAYRAHRRTGSKALRALSFGLGCITFGTLLGGILHQSGLATLLFGVAVQSISIALGFGFMGWSLIRASHVTDATDTLTTQMD